MGGEMWPARAYTGMRPRMMFLTVMALAALTPGIAAAKPEAAARERPNASIGLNVVRPVHRRPVRVECERPPTLRLIHFEDGSAQLRCGWRILVRVSAPD